MKGTVLEISWHAKEPVLSIHCGKQRFATAGADNDVKLWSMPVQEETNKSKIKFIASLTAHKAAVNAVRISNCELYVASASDDGTVIVWKQNDSEPSDSESLNLENWKMHHLFRAHRGDVYDLSWSPDSKYLASASIDNALMIWDNEKGTFLKQILDHKHYIQGVAWDPLNNLLASQSSDRSCRVYKVKPDGKGGLYTKIKASIGQITQQTEPGTIIRKRLFADETVSCFYRRLCFSPDGNFLFTPAGIRGKDNCVYGFTRVNLLKPVLCFPNLDKPAIAVRCCPKLFKLRPSQKPPMVDLPYRMVIAVLTLNSVMFYDTQHSHPISALLNFHYASLTDGSWSPDASMFFVSSRDGYCSIIDFECNEIGEEYVLSIKETPANALTPSSYEITPTVNEVSHNAKVRRVEGVC